MPTKRTTNGNRQPNTEHQTLNKGWEKDKTWRPDGVGVGYKLHIYCKIKYVSLFSRSSLGQSGIASTCPRSPQSPRRDVVIDLCRCGVCFAACYAYAESSCERVPWTVNFHHVSVQWIAIALHPPLSRTNNSINRDCEIIRFWHRSHTDNELSCAHSKCEWVQK